jgi:hypothetical protein
MWWRMPVISAFWGKRWGTIITQRLLQVLFTTFATSLRRNCDIVCKTDLHDLFPDKLTVDMIRWASGAQCCFVDRLSLCQFLSTLPLSGGDSLSITIYDSNLFPPCIHMQWGIDLCGTMEMEWRSPLIPTGLDFILSDAPPFSLTPADLTVIILWRSSAPLNSIPCL